MRPLKIILTSVTAGLVVGSGLVAAPALADDGLPRLTAPAAGALDAGTVPAFTLDTTGTTTGTTYAFQVHCNSSEIARADLVTDESGTITVAAYDAVPPSGYCTAQVTDTSQATTQLGSWSIAGAIEPAPGTDPGSDPDPQPDPVPDLENARASLSSFYPRVRDGFRDDVRISWTNQGYRDVRLEVRDAAGTNVRTAVLGWYETEWTWNGRSDAGSLVPAGQYQVVLTPSDELENTVSSRYVPVRVVTDVAAVRRTLNRAGSSSSVAASRSCYATRDRDYSYTTNLDCWGGRYARARYSFTLPAAAYSVRWSVRGTTTGADLCCDGRITKSGVRSRDKKKFTVTAQVTRWRAYEVRNVSVSYTVRARR